MGRWPSGRCAASTSMTRPARGWRGAWPGQPRREARRCCTPAPTSAANPASRGPQPPFFGFPATATTGQARVRSLDYLHVAANGRRLFLAQSRMQGRKTQPGTRHGRRPVAEPIPVSVPRFACGRRALSLRRFASECGRSRERARPWSVAAVVVKDEKDGAVRGWLAEVAGVGPRVRRHGGSQLWYSKRTRRCGYSEPLQGAQSIPRHRRSAYRALPAAARAGAVPWRFTLLAVISARMPPKPSARGTEATARRYECAIDVAIATSMAHSCEGGGAGRGLRWPQPMSAGASRRRKRHRPASRVRVSL